MDRQLRYIHGSLLRQVTDALNLPPTRGNTEAIKAMLKRAHGIDSLASLDDRGLALFIQQSAILLAGEFAIVVDLPGEDNVDRQSMKDFLKAIYQ